MDERYPRVRLFRLVMLAAGWLAVVVGGMGMATSIFGHANWVLSCFIILAAGACMLGIGQVLLLLLNMAEEVTEVRGMMLLRKSDDLDEPSTEPETRTSEWE